MPTRTVLHVAVPNPFNPMTTISYDLSQPTTVNLRIFDIGGRLVRTLLNRDVSRRAAKRLSGMAAMIQDARWPQACTSTGWMQGLSARQCV